MKKHGFWFYAELDNLCRGKAKRSEVGDWIAVNTANTSALNKK
jgi:hypothetical protein